MALLKSGRFDDAEAVFDSVLADWPSDPDALHFKGHIALAKGDAGQAARLMDAAIVQAPDRATIRYNRGQLALRAKDYQGARLQFEQVCRLDPDHLEARANLLGLMVMQGRAKEALPLARDLVERAPGMAPAWTNLGSALKDLGRFDEAFEAFDRSIQRDASRPEAFVNRANLARLRGDYDAARRFAEDLIARFPDHADGYNNLGVLLDELSETAPARQAYGRALALNPAHGDALSASLMGLLYEDGWTERALLDRHRDAMQPLNAFAPPRPRSVPKAGSALRLGFVSADFRRHSCAYFIEPLWRGLDRTRIRLHAFSDVRRPDAVTARLRGLSDVWHDTAGLEAPALADLVRADGIDVLVDLAGHSAQNRLAAFALRPAPVQLSWLGYPATTGLTVMDARLTDALADPPGAADPAHSERLIRMANGFLCYGPPDDAPAVAPPPSGPDGAVTFGSFNNLAKMSDSCVDLWARVLAERPSSRLVLKSRPLRHRPVRERTLARFVAAGIDADRIDLLDWIPAAEGPLGAYGRIDIALDTYPYQGTTTTCEALWMGVPVISLQGGRHAARVGGSLLARLGLSDLAVTSPDAFVEAALALAGNWQRRQSLRTDLRARFATSALCDVTGFGRSFVRSLDEILNHLGE